MPDLTSSDCPHPTPSLLLRKQYLSQRERGLSQFLRRFLQAFGRGFERAAQFLCVGLDAPGFCQPPVVQQRGAGAGRGAARRGVAGACHAVFGKGLLQGRFPRRELFLPLQVFQRVEARFFDAFQGGRQRAVNEVKVAAVAVADEGGVDEAGEVRFDVAFDGGLLRLCSCCLASL